MSLIIIVVNTMLILASAYVPHIGTSFAGIVGAISVLAAIFIFANSTEQEE